jgi:hypothetical protein
MSPGGFKGRVNPCDIWGPHDDGSEDWSLLLYAAVLSGRYPNYKVSHIWRDNIVVKSATEIELWCPGLCYVRIKVSEGPAVPVFRAHEVVSIRAGISVLDSRSSGRDFEECSIVGLWRSGVRKQPNVSGQIFSSIFRVGLVFEPEDEGHMFFRNFRFSSNYTAS